MDEYIYTNIFDTKGVEYLIIIGFLLLVIPFWIILNQPLVIKAKVKKAFEIITENILRIPKGLFYSKNHTWTQLESSGYAKVGLDDLLLHLTGDIKLINLKVPGEKVNGGDLIAKIIQNEKHLNIKSPISGLIKETNISLIENPEVLNEDPYVEGWIIKIKPDKWIEETRSFFLAEDAVLWLKNELARFKDFINTSTKKHSPELSMVIMQEGGELLDNPLSEMPNDVWQDFQAQFLDQIG